MSHPVFRPVLKVLETLHFCEHVIFGGRPHEVKNLEQLVTVVVEVRWLDTNKGSARESTSECVGAECEDNGCKCARKKNTSGQRDKLLI